MPRRWFHLRRAGVTASVVVLAVLVAGALQLGGVLDVGGVPGRRTGAQSNQSATPLTLQQAWDLFASDGDRWRRGAQVGQLASSNTSTDDASAGRDGRRVSWLAIVVAPDGNSTLRLHSLGSVIDSREVGPALPNLKPLSKPQIDSTAAIANTLASRPEFAPSTVKSVGFHFALKGGSPSFISVTGSLQGAVTSIDVDARSGAVASVSEYTQDATGGILYSGDGGRSWQASSLTGKNVRAVAAIPQQPRTAWAVVDEGSGIHVYQTTDGGRRWAESGQLPVPAGAPTLGATAANRNGATVLAVGTRESVWLSNDSGRTWNKAVGLPPGPAQFLAFESTGASPVLHVSVAAGPNTGLYRSRDMQAWERVGNVSRVSQINNYEAVATVEEATSPDALTKAASALLQKDTSRSPLALPTRVLRLAGDSSPGQTLLAEGPEAVHRSTDGGKAWQKVLDASLASLATAPNFSESGVGVAGGFRSGIYRTADGGRTWSLVLKDPASIVPGNNEIYSIAFTSALDVIAIQGGTASWKPAK